MALGSNPKAAHQTSLTAMMTTKRPKIVDII